LSKRIQKTMPERQNVAGASSAKKCKMI
jgi:hypothetical protein